ncbi:hypothetical protein AB1N83_005098 [Pleurotus pulmonarius]
MLTKETHPRLAAGIPTNELPQTFCDAVKISRNVGVRYLWIDSLCIFQDSKSDWSQEAAKMRGVYWNAICNIAATGADDSAAGMLKERNHHAVQPLIFTGSLSPHTMPSDVKSYVVVDSSTWHHYVRSALLNTRGWVFQERLLSPRILHVTKNKLYLECTAGITDETLGKGWDIRSHIKSSFSYSREGVSQGVSHFETTKEQTGQFSSNSMNSKVPEDTALQYWDEVVADYSGLAFTMPEDKFIALSGVIDEVKEYLEDEFMSGMWMKQFPAALLWNVDSDHTTPIERQEWRAPSWSWASTDKAVKFRTFEAIPIASEEPALKAFPRYELHVKVHIWPATLPLKPVQTGSTPRMGIICETVLGQDTVRIRVWPDGYGIVDQGSEAKLVATSWLLPVATGLLDQGNGLYYMRFVGGLLVTSSSTARVERLCVFHLEGDVRRFAIETNEWKGYDLLDKIRKLEQKHLVLV